MALPPPLPPTHTDCSCAAQLQQGSLEIDGDEAQGPGHTSHACSFTPTHVWLGDMLEDSCWLSQGPPDPEAPWGPTCSLDTARHSGTTHGTVGQPTAAAVLGQQSSPEHTAEDSRHDATSIHPCKLCAIPLSAGGR